MPKFFVTRSIEIEASPEEVYDRVVDFGTWTTWSPWLLAEPDARVRVSEDSRSVGSQYSWEGEVVGAGEIEHKKLQPGKSIEDEIRFLSPMKSVSKVGFTMQSKGSGTEVSWSMDGSLPWFLFWMRPMMEGFISMDYDRGLLMLKEWIETGHIKSKTEAIGIQPMGPFQVVGVRRQSTLAEISASMDAAFADAKSRIEAAGLNAHAEMVSVYHKLNMKTQEVEYTAGLLFGEKVEVPAGCESWELPEVQAFRVDHRGTYEHLGNAWSAANQIVRYKKLKRSKVGDFELYKNDPNHTPPEDLLTEIYLPLR